MRKSDERWRWRGVVLLAGLLAMAPAAGRAMQTTSMQLTQVQDVVHRADGSLAEGTLLVSWPSFTGADGSTVAAGTVTATIAPDGSVTMKLAPNEGAEPQGSYYTAVYHLSDGTVQKEYWVVPQSATTTISQMRTKVVPAAVAQESVSRQYVDSSINAAQATYLPLKGGALTGPLALAMDPTSATQAATKGYVDAHSGATLPATQLTIAGNGAGAASPLESIGTQSVTDASGAAHRIIAFNEDPSAGVYDPRNPKYDGGIFGPAPWLALQDASNAAACDLAMGTVQEATIALPQGSFAVSNLILAPGSHLAGIPTSNGGSEIHQRYNNAFLVQAPSSYTLFCQDGQQHTDSVQNTLIENITMHGCGQGCPNAPGDTGSYPNGGPNDAGIEMSSIAGIVQHVSANNFGGTAIRADGQDTKLFHLHVMFNNEFYLFNAHSFAADEYHGDVEAAGADTWADDLEIYGTLHTPGAEYGHLAGLLAGGGYSNFDHVWPQLEEIGIMEPYGYGAGDRFTNFRVDFSMGEGIRINEAAAQFSTGIVDGSCVASNIASLNNGLCDQVSALGLDDKFSNVLIADNPGFGATHKTADIQAANSATFREVNGSFEKNATIPYGVGWQKSFDSTPQSVTGPAPDVSAYNVIGPADTAPITYTNLTNAMTGEEVWIGGGNANVTLEDKSSGGYFVTCGGQNLNLAAPVWYHFKVYGGGELYGIPATIAEVCSESKSAVNSGGLVPSVCSGAALFYLSDYSRSYGCGADHAFHVIGNTTFYLNTSFNEAAAGVALAGSAPATGLTGATWQGASGGQWQYASGGGVTDTGTGDPANQTISIDVGHANYTAYYYGIPIVPSGGGFQISTRLTDSNNFVALNLEGSTASVFDVSNGTVTNVGSIPVPAGDSGAVVVKTSGNTMTFSVFDQPPFTVTLPANSTNTTSTKLGANVYGAGIAMTLSALTVTP